ncbi:MAG: hypothetical protein ACRDYC_09645 [Acidimicrobiales bacterium]
MFEVDQLSFELRYPRPSSDDEPGPAHKLHSLYDSRDLTAEARRVFDGRFLTQVDPDGRLPEGERTRRAESARKAYFVSLAAKSARARRRRG